MRSKIGLFFTVLLLMAVMAAQKKPATSKTAPKTQKTAHQAIAKLKATPVADMESGLPDEPFGKWFVAQVKPAVPQYEVKECDESSDKAAGLKCVVASAKVGGMKLLELSFAVPPASTSPAPKTKPKNIRETQYQCRFLVGSLGPSNPQMKFPTRVVRKLSDLAPMLQP